MGENDSMIDYRVIIGRVISKIRQYKYHIDGGSRFEKNVYFNRNTNLHGWVKFEKNSSFVNCEIENGVEIGPNCHFIGCKIGKYTIMDANNKNICGNHPVNFYVAMSNLFYRPRKQHGLVEEQSYFAEYKYADKEKKYHNIIGNDVYITNDVSILEGVRIGDGAVITPGSVVTKHVPPYAIVRGNPAEVVTYRFSREYIDFLEELKWWDKDEEWIKAHVQYFSNVKKLKKIVEEENNVR